MAEMSETQLVSLLNASESNAVAFNGEFMEENESLFKRYNGELYGDEVEGRSQVVSTDVFDVVEADMPSIVRTFLGSGDIGAFEPNSNREDEIEEAEDKSKYVNWLIREQPESFQILHGWLKDAEIQKMGVIKYFVEDSRTTKTHKFTGVDLFEIEEIQKSFRGEDVSKIEITGQLEDEETGKFDLEFRVTRGEQKFKMEGVPTESFLISRNASSLEDAEMVGDKSTPTRGELLSQGFDRDLISMLPTFETDSLNQTTLKQQRFKDQGGESTEEINDWASEEVELITMSVRIDFDGDGIAERRLILKSGNHILENEPFDHVPYATLSAILMPHTAIGKSRAEITVSTQRIKTVVLRQILDNLYLVNNGRNIVSDDVNLDDMLTVRPNGIVRTEGAVDAAVFPLVTQYVGDKALQVVQYLDFTRAQSTGTLMASQGLNADTLANETATRFMGVQEEGSAKIELVARVYAETGFKKLYEGFAWMVAQFQDSETEFRVLGKALKVNPSGWKYNHHLKTNIGLGAGDNDKTVQSMTGLLQIQQQLKTQGSALVDEVDIYNTLDRIVKGLGLPSTHEFFNNPEEDDELLKAQNEILTNVVQQLQQQVQQLQNPLLEPALINAKGKLLEAQGKAGIEAAKVTENARQFDDQLEADRDKELRNLAFKITELEAKINEDVSQQQNQNVVDQI